MSLRTAAQQLGMSMTVVLGTTEHMSHTSDIVKCANIQYVLVTAFVQVGLHPASDDGEITDDSVVKKVCGPVKIASRSNGYKG